MISLCVPSRGRPERFTQMVESARRTAAGEFEVVGWLDDDDPTGDRYPSDVVYGHGPRPPGAIMSGLWTKAWELASGDIAMLAADDIMFRTRGWDRMVEDAFAAVPDQLVMVYGNDGTHRKAPVLPFVSRRWIELAGFTPPDYQGWFSDEWIWAMAAAIRRVVYLPRLVIRHYQGKGDQTYQDAEEARNRAGGLMGMIEHFYSAPEAEKREDAIRKLRTGMVPGIELVPDPLPAWFTESLERTAGAALNPDTLVSIHCWRGDEHLVRHALPIHLRHRCPVVVLSPEDSPVDIDGVECRSAGKRGYFGQDSLDRQRAHMEMLLEYPQNWFLMNDADSMCMSAKIPDYLYKHDHTVWSNQVRERRPHPSPYPKLAFQPPYFMHRKAIERMLAVGPIEAHPITPFIDWMMVAMTSEAGLRSGKFGDGRSLPAWRHQGIAETKDLGHDFVHVPTEQGFDGARYMEKLVERGTVLIHSVKHEPVLDALVAAHDRYQRRLARRR